VETESLTEHEYDPITVSDAGNPRRTTNCRAEEYAVFFNQAGLRVESLPIPEEVPAPAFRPDMSLAETIIAARVRRSLPEAASTVRDANGRARARVDGELPNPPVAIEPTGRTPWIVAAAGDGRVGACQALKGF